MEEFLKQLSSSSGRHFWDGESSEIKSVNFDLSSTLDFRPPAEMQGSFDFVWSLEKPLNDLGWKIRLDEMIRLLPSQGTLTFSYVQNEFISIPAVKSFLYRKYGVKSELIYEKISAPVIINTYKIERTQYQPPKKIWTFGMLTQGKKPELVEDFCKSVRDFGGPEHEIIICGPYSSILDKYQVVYNSKAYSPLYADICRKKNDIVNMAKHENIMLLHDRYILNSDFFTGFEKYGYDFDFLTIRQYHASGKNYPAYCSIDDKGELIWGQISECTDYKKSWHSHYLNGGLLVGKTTLFKEIPFNDAIFHNQAEDVELTRVMLDAKIVPRFNMHSSSRTDVPDHLTNAFVVSNLSDLEKNIAGANSIWKILEVPPSDFPSRVLLKVIKVLVKSYAVRNIGRVPWKEIFKKGIKKTNAFLKSQVKKKFFSNRVIASINSKYWEARWKLKVKKQRPQISSGVNIITNFVEGGVFNATCYMARQLIREGVPVAICNIFPHDHSNMKQDFPDLEKYVSKEPLYGINILSDGFPFNQANFSRLRKILQRRYNINYTFWELPKIPKRLFVNLRYPDEIWAGSDFVRDAIKSVDANLNVSTFDLNVQIDASYGRKYDRSYFRLPKDKVLFLASYSFSSGGARKNQDAVIRCFGEAINKDDAALVLYIHLPKIQESTMNTAYETFKAEIKSKFKNNIIVLEQKQTSYEEQIGLKRSCDCYISLHRSEGYGLNCAETAEVGNLVVMTDWSGSNDIKRKERWSSLIFPVKFNLVPVKATDFIWVSSGEERLQFWAEPDTSDAISKIQQAYESAKRRSRPSELIV